MSDNRIYTGFEIEKGLKKLAEEAEEYKKKARLKENPANTSVYGCHILDEDQKNKLASDIAIMTREILEDFEDEINDLLSPQDKKDIGKMASKLILLFTGN